MRGNGNDVADTANREALARVAAARPVLVDIRPAGEVIAGICRHDLLHAGPPLDGWGEACGALRGAAAAGTLFLAGSSPNADVALAAAATALGLRPG